MGAIEASGTKGFPDWRADARYMTMRNLASRMLRGKNWPPFGRHMLTRVWQVEYQRFGLASTFDGHRCGIDDFDAHHRPGLVLGRRGICGPEESCPATAGTDSALLLGIAVDRGHECALGLGVAFLLRRRDSSPLQTRRWPEETAMNDVCSRPFIRPSAHGKK